MSTNDDQAPRTIAISSQKGGVGKTTTTANLAATWAECGRRVLAIDLDPQFAPTRPSAWCLRRRPPRSSTSWAGQAETPDAVVKVGENLDVLAADRDLTKLELTLVAQTKREDWRCGGS